MYHLSPAVSAEVAAGDLVDVTLQQLLRSKLARSEVKRWVIIPGKYMPNIPLPSLRPSVCPIFRTFNSDVTHSMVRHLYKNYSNL